MEVVVHLAQKRSLRVTSGNPRLMVFVSPRVWQYAPPVQEGGIGAVI